METRIAEVRREVERQINVISEISDWKYRMICLFSLLDCFAQEVAGYPSNKNREVFCSFIEKYDDTFPYWNEIDTVSFFYRNTDLFAGNDPTSFMMDGGVYYCQEIINRQEQDLFRYVDKIKYEKELNRHKYVNLFYILRNKLVHELSTPNGLMWVAEERIPFYASFSILTSTEKVDTWPLTFPCVFIEGVVKTSIDNYLQQCLQEMKEPFQNANPFRDYYIKWVE